MKKITEIELTGLQKSILWVVAFSSILLKVIFDSFFLLLDQYDVLGALILRFCFSLITLFSLIILFYTGFNSNLTIHETGFDSYISEILKILSISFMLLIVSLFLPISTIGGDTPNNFIEVVFINYYSVCALILTLISFRFLVKWIWFRRFKSTKIYIKLVIVITVLLVFVIDLPNYFSHIEPEEIKSNQLLLTLSLLFNISLVVIAFLASSRNQWIPSLSLSDKWKLLGSSLVLSILSILFIVSDLSHEGDGNFTNSLASVFPVESLFGVSTLLILVYSTRVFFSVMLSLPTSSIIERKTGEFNSLTYLGRVISREIDFDSLIDTVSSLSLTSGNGSVVWTDLKDANGQYRISSMKFSQNMEQSIEQLQDTLVQRFYINNNDLISSILEPKYIESIPDSNEESIKSLEKIFNSKSMIIMPMHSGKSRVGTLYLLHPNEYGFDSEFLNLFSAFHDNLNIAVENIRLVEESIEKEKYKNELKIARDMERKLIPQIMPNELNNSLSGYSISADDVGGDYYDVVTLKDGNRCLIIADVSGKGMSAAFYMVLLKGVVLSVSNQVNTVGELLKRINNILFPEMEKKMFITLAAVKLNDQNGNIEIARAGHMPFLLKKKGDVAELRPKGIGIGLASSDVFDSTLEQLDTRLNPGESLFMYSDGIVEIFKEGIELPSDFLKQLIKNSVYTDSKELLNEIRTTIENMKNEYTIIDDMTLVCLTYKDSDKMENENA